MKATKKLIAMLLSAIMLLALMPAAAFADSGDTKATVEIESQTNSAFDYLEYYSGGRWKDLNTPAVLLRAERRFRSIRSERRILGMMFDHIPAILHKFIEVTDVECHAQAFLHIHIHHFAVSQQTCFTELPLEIREGFTAGLHDD